jgi:hypothetical protein
MTVIWVAEDINKDGTFKQTKAEVLCTLSCLLFIKHYYPNFKTIFFVDQYTKEYYEQFGFLHLFDEINNTLLNENIEKIDKKFFWAVSKIRAQRFVEGPTLTMDLDFRIFDDLTKFGVFEEDMTCLWVEQIDDLSYYHPIKALGFTDLRWDYKWTDRALNVSFLYIKNDNFKKLYCDTALEYMRASYKRFPIPSNKWEKNKPILFAEQYMLYQLAIKENQTVKVLIDDFNPPPEDQNIIRPGGLTMETCGYYLYHFASYKEDMRNRTERYYNELSACSYVTNNVITNKSQLEIFNKLYNLKDDEGCFC